MKARVNTFLNIRTRKPEILPDNNPGNLFYRSGDIIEIADTVNGAEYKKNSTWYQLEDGAFVWSGGVEKVDIPASPDIKKGLLQTPVSQWKFDAAKMSWAHDSVANGGLGVVDLWNKMGVRGEDIKVAVIDTGVTEINNDLKGKINKKLSIDCVDFGNIDDTNSPEFHGTKSAGIIGANGGNVNTVCGVAPECELIIYRLFSNENMQGYTDQNFCFVLQEARKAKVDIISMSFQLTDKPEGIDKEIQACLDQNILLIASVGDENQSVGIRNNFPASLPGCVSVGAYRKLNNTRLPFAEHSCKSNFLFCLAPGDNILTTGNTSKAVFHQFTSAAAPFVAGVFASILSFRKKRGLPVNINDLIAKLEKACDKLNKTKVRDEIEGFGIINPLSLFNLLKQ